MIMINRAGLVEWAEQRIGFAHNSLADLVALPEVRGLLREEIVRLGVQLAARNQSAPLCAARSTFGWRR